MLRSIAAAARHVFGPPMPRAVSRPYLGLLRRGGQPPPLEGPLTVATYNVHRWTGPRMGRNWNPEPAIEALAELDADVLALQEVLRPVGADRTLENVADRFGYHVAFCCTRVHDQGELGNAVLSRYPIRRAVVIDLTFGKLERRAAMAAEIDLGAERCFYAVATHLALIDRMRARQVSALLEHPTIHGPTVLMGDMNAWRPSRATRGLDEHFRDRHHNTRWPVTFPSSAPILALDRIYTRGARIVELRAHDSPAARSGSDHRPVVATVELDLPDDR
jgi:endonuclease/exonuclease/phosphatase family metal-dependent hydrolase